MTTAACPKCREEGRDRSGDNLFIFPEGNTFCHACGYKGTVGDEMEEDLHVTTEKKRASALSVEDILELPIGTIPARVIDESVAQTYQTRVAFNETTGEIDKVYYPYYEYGEVVAYKQRKVGVPKKYAFEMIGKHTTLFGRNPTTKGNGRLMIVEGEEDALAAKQMLTIGTIPKECDVVSLPHGAGLDKAMRSQLEFIKAYQPVVICLDNDGPGRKASLEIAAWLAASTTVKIVDLPHEYGKDASDFHCNGHQLEFLLAVKEATLYIPEGIINGTEIELDSLLEKEPEGYTISFAGLHRALHGLRKAEIVTLCADSGIGKTTFSRELSKALIEQDAGVALIALEDQLEITAKSLIALDMNIPLSTFRFHPPSKSECQPSFDKLIGRGQTFFYRHKGGLDNNTLLNTIAAYARSGSVDFIVLDHIGVALAGTDNPRTSEAKAIDILMNKLADLVKETGVGFICIAHLKRKSDGVVHPEGREVLLTDLRGSASLEQVAWAVVALERDQQAEEEKDNNKVRVRVLKNRVFSRTGVIDRLVYNPETGRLLNAPVPPPIVMEEPLLESA